MTDGSSEMDEAEAANQEALRQLTNATLRENLHLAINRVFSRRFRDERVRDLLTEEVLAVIDGIVDDHIAAQELGREMPVVEIPATPATAEPAGTVEQVMATLKERVQAMLNGGRPGLRKGASAAMKLSPLVVNAFSSFANDPVALGQAQRSAETVLSRHLHPVIARQVVSFAATAVRRAAESQSREPGPQEPGTQHET